VWASGEVGRAMTSAETRKSRLSFFGRTADDLTRQVLLGAETGVFLDDERKAALVKSDGHFVFANLEPSATDYRIHIDAPSYQDRVIAKALPGAAAVQVMLAGEDELYLLIGSVLAAQNRITFEQNTVVPPIEAGAAVIGQGGFTATLAEALEGQKIAFAALSTVAGLAAGQLLRIVRGNNLLLRPGPYYPFPPDTTVLAVKVVANDPVEPALGDAGIEITRLNGNAPTMVDVGGLSLSSFSLGGSPPGSIILDDDDKKNASNDRGDTVFYFAGSKQITSIEVAVTKSKFQAFTSSINVTAKTRNFRKIALTAL
jgi:hypothetical protein